MNKSEDPTTSKAEILDTPAKVRLILSSVATIAGLIYLGFFLLFGLPKERRFTQVEAIVFASILILNSELISKISKLSISDKGIEILAEKKAREVAQNEVKKVETTAQDAQNKVAIVKDEQKNLEDILEKQKELLGFIVLFTKIIDPNEIQHLRNLRDLTNGAARQYTINSTVVSQLRKLADLGFIQRKKDEFKKDKPIASLKALPPPVDITQTVEITEDGIKYLKLLDLKEANQSEQGQEKEEGAPNQDT